MLDTVLPKRIEEGKYKVLFTEYTPKEVQSSGETKEYTEVLFKTDDSVRVEPLKFIVFPNPKTMNYVLGAIKTQLNLENKDYTAKEIFDAAVGQELDIVISYNEYGMNIALHDSNYQTESVNPEDVDV